MKITPKQYALSLYQSISGKNEKEISDIIDNFVNVVIENNNVSKINKIIEQFEIIWNKEEGIVEAGVVSARKLDNKIVKLLDNYVAELTGAEKVIMSEQVDKNILGGVVIRYGDKVLDGSVKTRIDNLKNELAK